MTIMSHSAVFDPDVTYIEHGALTKEKLVYPAQVSFFPVDGASSSFKVVEYGFKKLIAPVYGDQSEALKKIQKAKDRNCELMYHFKNPLGVIVYKNRLQNEYGLRQGLELKTLFLLNPEKNSGHGFGSYLFKRIETIAKEMNADLIYCTASSKVENSINCALKNGYKIDRVLERDDSHILYLLTRVLSG